MREWEDVLSELQTMADHLERMAPEFPGDRARLRPSNDEFAFVEQVWHLADLEREGFAERIRRLLSEENPTLPDFDGARLARERDYRSLPVAEGLAAFARSRAANLAALRLLTDAESARVGLQEGVGPVTLGSIPGRMLEHDRSHRGELEELRQRVDPG